MRKSSQVLLVTTLLLSTGALADTDTTFALGLNGGSKGVGFDAVYNLSDHFNLRATYSKYDISESFDEDDIEYDGDFELDNTGLLLDYYPFAGSFRLSVGYISNGNMISASAQPGSGGTVDINGYDYDVTDEWVKVAMDWDSGAPYFGIGWGNAFRGSNLTFTFDLGVMQTGEPSAALSASQGLYDSATIAGRDLQADLDAEEASLNDDLSDFDMYPVIQLGLTYSF